MIIYKFLQEFKESILFHVSTNVLTCKIKMVEMRPKRNGICESIKSSTIAKTGMFLKILLKHTFLKIT